MLAWLQCKWSFDVASWMLAQLRYEWNVDVASWQKWSVDVTSWLHECWHGIGANGALTWLHECWHGFNTNEVLSWLHGKDGCWHGFDTNEVLMWLGANIGATSNASASANVECCRGFMEKMNVGIALIRMNCWRSFMASVRMKWWTLAWLRCKRSVVVASWQKWMLA